MISGKVTADIELKNSSEMVSNPAGTSYVLFVILIIVVLGAILYYFSVKKSSKIVDSQKVK